ncbi:hypothetical protein GQ53DRAFT_848224 [Thozetella sp. PMI_491]|nr:hypothetical protein GQ53DRAFT_848224 [Thozetella sp. PMI_491]
MVDDARTTQQNPYETPWAKELLKRPLVEIRRGLSLGYGPPKENSSVLALTAPSGKFVDIRFALSADHKSTIKEAAENFAGYATAGLATAEILPGTDTCVAYECVAHVKWQHILDSSHSFNTDGADMYLLANGDVMEVGTMEREGKTHMFKEYWIGPVKEAKQLPCIVMEVKGGADGEELKGMAIRIGDFCQGILQDRDVGLFWLERWEVPGHDGHWVRDAKSSSDNTVENSTLVPCKWMTEERKKVGDHITLDGRKWEVTEVFEG